MKFLKKISDAILGNPASQVPDASLLSYDELRSDYNIRTNYYQYSSKKSGVDERLLNWNGSVDYSGHVREKCLRYLINNYLPGDENRILLRLEDWVPEIRDIAAKWLEEHIDMLSYAEVKAQQDVLLFLSRKERLLNSSIMQLLDSYLRQLVATCDESEFFEFDIYFRRHMYQISIPEDDRIRRLIARDPNPFNRLWILRLVEIPSLCESERQWLRYDPSPFVKRRYLHCRLAVGENPSEEELLELAFERSNPIRRSAQFYLRSIYNIDVYDHYKQRDDDCFYYIADYAKPEDVDYLVQGLDKGRQRMRTLCLKAVCRIDPAKLREIGIEKLLLKSNRNRNIIVPLLPKFLSIPELQALKDVFLSISDDGILQYLNMMDKKSHWLFLNESLSYLVEDQESKRSEILRRVLYVKAHLYEPISQSLQDSIIENVSRAREGADRYMTRMLDTIEYVARNPNTPVRKDQ